MKRDLICISCPMGCKLIVDTENLTVSGNTCKRGIEYGIKEVTSPVRVITTTVKIINSTLPVLPVKTNGAIPKGLNMKCIDILNKVEVQAPIKVGDIIIKNILDTGIDVVASRSLSILK